jgi:hypothetical protein
VGSALLPTIGQMQRLAKELHFYQRIKYQLDNYILFFEINLYFS